MGTNANFWHLLCHTARSYMTGLLTVKKYFLWFWTRQFNFMFPTCIERGKDFKTGWSTQICHNDWSLNCCQISCSKSALQLGRVQLSLAKAEVPSTAFFPSVRWGSLTVAILLHPLKRDLMMICCWKEWVVITPSLGSLSINRLIDTVYSWRWILPLMYQLQRGFSHCQRLLFHSVIIAKGCYAFSISTRAPAMTHRCEDKEVFHPTSAVSSQVTIVRSMNVILMTSLDVTRHGD